MKKIFFLASLLSIVFCFSCSNENQNVDSKVADEVSNLQMRSVSEMETLEEYHIAFTMLSDTEKYTAWRDYLNELLVSEHFNSAQTALINELLSKIKPEAWTKTNSYHAWFTDIYIKDFITRASAKFTNSQVTTYFFKVGKKIVKLDNTFVDKPDCACLKSEYTQWDCGFFNDSTCGTSNCKEVDGCGALNTSFCDGRCS